MNTEAAINSLLEYIRRTLLTNLNSQNMLFLTEKYSPFEKYLIERNNLSITWHGNAKLIEFEEPYRIYTHKYIRSFTLEGGIWFKSSETGILVEKEYLETLMVEAILNFTKHDFNFTIYNEEKKFLKEFNDKVIETCKEKDLIGFDNLELKIDDKGLSSIFTEITRKQRTNAFPKPFHDFNTFDDLTRVTQDIRFLIGQLIMYKPYITNYLSGKTYWKGQTFFRYFPSIFDKRFFMTSGLIIGLLYNYWDKIGDLLDNCFGVITAGKNVYFGTVIKKLPNQYHASTNYIWLKGFKDNEFQDLLNKRNEIIHYSALESRYFEQYKGHFKDEGEIQKLQEEKEGIVSYLINHNQMMFTGFERAIKLIDEIP
ncbi:MAG: hypothetical protein H6571_21860 [Lewinellaceae bacterium]|nr:hypothetical protein [Lewinellaceae bacterium]